MLFLTLILITIIISQIKGDHDNCVFSNPLVYHQTFPSRLFMSYNETRNLLLRNYFSGVNITYDVTSSSNHSDVRVPPKTIVLDDPFSFNSILTENNLGEVVDIFWDDTSVPDLVHSWAAQSTVIILAYNKTANPAYSLLIGSIGSLKPDSRFGDDLFNIIHLDPMPGVESDTMFCYKVVSVGKLSYFVDCVSYNFTQNIQTNYFIAVILSGVPPYSYATKYLENSLNLTQTSTSTPREIKSILVQDQQFLLRYYKGLDIPNSNNVSLYSGIELWDVTSLMQPFLKLFYDPTQPSYPYVSNISSIELSESYLYVISSQEQVTIVTSWFSKPVQEKSYTFPDMVFKASSLRRVATPVGVKESLVVIGSLYSANFAALMFSSQVYQGYYSVPIPPTEFQQTQFKAHSLTLGEDFWVLSYSTATPSSEISCNYLAIFDYSTPGLNSYHSLIPYDSNSFIRFVKMNPASNQDTLVLLSKDNVYEYISIYSPNLLINSVTQTENITLTLQNLASPLPIQFEIIVVPPNSTQIYFKYDDTSDVVEYISSRGFQSYFPLNSPLYGPDLLFSPLFEDPVKYSKMYSSQTIITNLQTLSGKLIACRRGNVSSTNPMMIVESTPLGTTLNYGDIFLDSEFSIHHINFQKTDNIFMYLQTYFSIGNFDVYQLGELDKPQYLLFHNVSEPFNLWNQSSMRFSLSDYTSTYCIDIQLLLIGPSQVSISCIDETSLHIIVLDIQDASLSLSYNGVINQSMLNNDHNFVPESIRMHPSYPSTVFVLTATKNLTYVINYTNPTSPTAHGSILSAYKVIFGNFAVNPCDHVYIQPFLNSFFFIVPTLNLIQHWDISNAKASYMRRNLDLYHYDIHVLNTLSGPRGITFSTTNDLLYLIAMDSIKNVFTILVLKPNDANSHLVRAIALNTISAYSDVPTLEVTTVQKGTLGYTLGDILCIVSDKTYTFWEVYPTPYLVFEPEIPSGDFVNSIVRLNSLAQNIWTTTSMSLNFQILEDEKGLYYANNTFLQVSNQDSFAQFGINSLVGGTIYSVEVPGANTMKGVLNFTNFISNQTLIPFLVENTITTWKLQKNTYYLTQDQVTVVENQNNTSRTMQIEGTSKCSKLYIDRSETYGVAICDLSPNTGLIPFSIDDLTLCDTVILSQFKEISINKASQFMFILSKGEGEENDAILVYELDHTGCAVQGQTPTVTIPSWKFAVNEPDFKKFDNLLFVSNPTEQEINIFFVFDANYGLRVINLASRYLDTTKQIATIPLSDIFYYYNFDTSSLRVLDISAVNNQCDNLEHSEQCPASVLLVSKNFHCLLLEFDILNLGDQISQINYTSFLVPQDYEIKNYQLHKDLLILLGTNTTGSQSTLDMLAYNLSSSALSYSNRLEPLDTTKYKSPIWVQTLIKDLKSYQDKTKIVLDSLGYPLIFIENATNNNNNNNSIYQLSFPNLERQTFENYQINQNLQLVWDKATFSSYNNISIIIRNNHEEVVFQLMFEKEDEGLSSLQKVLLALGMVILTILVIIGIMYLRKKQTNKMFIFSKKKQKDPLRRLLVN